MPNTERRLAAVVWLHIGFAATGFGTTLLGCLLPASYSAWNFTDARAGFLFACQFTGVSLGALLEREYESRRRNRIAVLLRESGLPREKTMANFDLKRLLVKAGRQLKALVALPHHNCY